MKYREEKYFQKMNRASTNFGTTLRSQVCMWLDSPVEMGESMGGSENIFEEIMAPKMSKFDENKYLRNSMNLKAFHNWIA